MRNVNPLRKLYNRIAQRLGKDDLVYLSAGAMCDMAWVVHGPITGEKSDGFIHEVNGRWILNVKKVWACLQPYANEGARFHRTAMCVGGTAPRKSLLMPWQYVPASDAWDLRVKNQVFFDLFREFLLQLQAMKLIPVVCLKNECDERKDDRKAQSPYFHNINIDKTEGLYDKRVIPFDVQLVKWILEAAEGIEIYVELINEGHRRNSGSVEWVEAILPILYGAGIEPWRIILGADVVDYTFTGIGSATNRWRERWPDEPQPPKMENYDHFMNRLVKVYDKKFPNATHQALYVCHSFAERANEKFPDQAPMGTRTQYMVEALDIRILGSNRIFASTDGTDHADDPGGRPSAKRMKAAMLYVFRANPRYQKTPLIDGRPKFWFDYLPNKQSVETVTAIVRAMAEAYHEFFGVWPVNRGKVPPYVAPVPPPPEPEPPEPPAPPEPEPPTPEPPTPPAPEPEPEPQPEPKPAEPWYSWNRIRNVRRWTWQAWLVVVILIVMILAIF